MTVIAPPTPAPRSRGSITASRVSTAQGRRYHALNPETFYWAHATFFMLIIKTADYFCGGLTEAEKHQLFDEHVQWYRMYGMSMRPVPDSWEDFLVYWDQKCREELEINRATLDIFTIRIPKPWFVLMPTAVWDQLFKPMVGAQRWVAAGRVRRAGAGEGRDALDARRRDSAAAVRQGGRAGVHRGARRDPAASASGLGLPPRRREHPADAPLVEAPGFMAPAGRPQRPADALSAAGRNHCWTAPGRWSTPPSRWPDYGRRAGTKRKVA